ncbi:MAG: hypothetical protein RLZZ611_1313 [Cyanobacteriota bacterium]
MNEPLPPWRPLLRGARQREGRSPQARWLQLATLGRDGAPRVRTLVFRGWGGPAQLDLLTDARSSKSSELQAEPRLELCWLLPKARAQFRLRGRRLVMAPEEELAARQRHWLQLHPGARSLWGWPEPGAPLQTDAVFPSALADGTPTPECFELVRIQLERVELLELTGHPHQRRRWHADQDWAEERLNP